MISHDKQELHLAAFNALKYSLASKLLSLEKQYFFNAPMCFESFTAFEQLILKVTYCNHSFSDELAYAGKKDAAHFQMHICIVPLRNEHSFMAMKTFLPSLIAHQVSCCEHEYEQIKPILTALSLHQLMLATHSA